MREGSRTNNDIEPSLLAEVRRSQKAGLRTWLGGLRAKLIAPYLLLALAISLVGMFIITRLVTSSIRERFVNQLLEASRVAADALVRTEEFHLEQLRQMAFTRGVPEATFKGDWEQLQGLLHPIVLNHGLELVSVVDQSGRELLSLVRSPETETYSLIRDSDLSNYGFIQWTLEGVVEQRGDKYVNLIETEFGEFLVTSAPILFDDQVVGVLLAGTQLRGMLFEIKQQALSDLVILDREGQALLTTLPLADEGYPILNLQANDLSSPELSEIRKFSLDQREYQAHYSPMIIRANSLGLLGVVLPSNFIVTTEATSRNLFSLLFAIGTTGIIVFGIVIARSISRPILRIRDVSLAVASGDLNKRTGVRGFDEIGQMGTVFDLMTSRLRKRTHQVINLYKETKERSEELERANLRLQQAHQQLVQSEKLASVGQLTAGIVHDVKTPLAVILGLAEDAQEEDQIGPIQESLGLIGKHARRANEIISDLLKFARQSNPEIHYQDLCETVQAAARLTDFLARKAGVKVKISAAPDHIYTSYDARLMEQVLVNLIQNAIQAMKDGGNLDIFIKENEQWVGVAVRDTGTGIPKKNLARIFDPFFTTKPEGEGTGLGLSVSYGIVAQHRGQIMVESEEGKGSIFIVKLPKVELESVEAVET